MNSLPPEIINIICYDVYTSDPKSSYNLSLINKKFYIVNKKYTDEKVKLLEKVIEKSDNICKKVIWASPIFPYSISQQIYNISQKLFHHKSRIKNFREMLYRLSNVCFDIDKLKNKLISYQRCNHILSMIYKFSQIIIDHKLIDKTIGNKYTRLANKIHNRLK
jgi:hypothetical protein